ncbi:hypothetical protein QBC37DRAFT_487097 [Rhypophila decipiens]|uniref:Uncharacterized protein n=1 Tax=Rhypophila decipiens TaxID=261697 RepID=A0AAN6Y2A3_9PEZI|nr:hypothetical protein QBC37DRAFT_487097 [Rhypophila decipiens]
MFNIKSLIILGLSATLTTAGPIDKRDSAPITPTDPTVALAIDPAVAAAIWADVTIDSGLLLNNTSPDSDDAPGPALSKRADFCYDYWLNNDQVQQWGNAWQASSATTWIPSSQWRSWTWDSANLKLCAVNRYIAVWDGTDVSSWELGWAMKAIGWDCYESFHTKGGRITGHGSNGRGVHIYLTDKNAGCW